LSTARFALFDAGSSRDQEEAIQMTQFGIHIHNEKHKFDSVAFLAYAGPGRKSVGLKPKSTLFSQGDPADSVFYIQEGRVKLTVVSQSGKAGTIMFLSPGDFAGEGSLATATGLRTATATAVNSC
jgi:CRP-like cAMP-binding protein